MNLPQGYEPHEIPPDYTGPLFLESQMLAVIEAEREACAKLCEQAGIDGYGTLAAAAMIRSREKDEG